MSLHDIAMDELDQGAQRGGHLVGYQVGDGTEAEPDDMAGAEPGGVARKLPVLATCVPQNQESAEGGEEFEGAGSQVTADRSMITSTPAPDVAVSTFEGSLMTPAKAEAATTRHRMVDPTGGARQCWRLEPRTASGSGPADDQATA
jgi:hypothetical protein